MGKRKTTDGMCHFHHLRGIYYQSDIIVDLDLDHLPEVRPCSNFLFLLCFLIPISENIFIFRLFFLVLLGKYVYFSRKIFLSFHWKLQRDP